MVPRHVRGGLCDIVALGGRNRNRRRLLNRKLFLQVLKVFDDGVEPFLPVPDEIHLVDGKQEGPDPHQRADSGVASRLDQNPLRGVHQNHGEVRERRAHRHVAGVFLVPRGVRRDEATGVGGEIAVGHVDRDALLPLRHQTVQQQRVVDGATAAANLAVENQRLLLVCVQQF